MTTIRRRTGEQEFLERRKVAKCRPVPTGKVLKKVSPKEITKKFLDGQRPPGYRLSGSGFAVNLDGLKNLAWGSVTEFADISKFLDLSTHGE